MAKPKVYLFIPNDRDGTTYRQLEKAGCDLMYGNPDWRVHKGATIEQFQSGGKGAVALIGTRIEGVRTDAKALSTFPDLRVLARYNIGYDDVDLEDCTKLGVLVTHAPVESNWGGVAEGAFSMMLTMLKRLYERDQFLRDGGWRTSDLDGTYLGPRHDGYPGITVGIIGLGRIGSRFADLLQPWRVRILAHDPHIDESKFVHHNATAADLDTVFRDSDVITMHCDLNKDTNELINERTLALMKPTALLINTARGPLVNEDALYKALTEDKLGGAALDVFVEEPLPKQSALLGIDRHKLLVSPHMVGSGKGGPTVLAVQWATDAALSALRGEVPKHVVNPEVVPQWRARFGGKSLL